MNGPNGIFDTYKEDEKHLVAIVGSKALAKACLDSFDYALKLRTGEVIFFSEATVLNREWIHLEVKSMEDQPTSNRIAYPAMRGVDIRLSDIVWVMDAPMGS